MSEKYNRKDHLYQQAKREGYRSRAAYKLIELNKKYKFFKSGRKTGLSVLDLGAWPGGWTQVALENLRAPSQIIALDLLKLEPLNATQADAANLITIEGDMLDSNVRERIAELCPAGVDVLLSDMSPKLSGISFRDGARSAELVEMALSFAEEVLAKGAWFIAKIFPSPEAESIAKEIKKKFEKFYRVNLDSTRKTSNEIYFVAQGFKRSE